MNLCPNSTNNTSYLILGKNTYPGDDIESYYVAADDVNKVFQSGKIPLITTEKHANDGKPIIAIVLAQDKAPEREEKDYSIHPDYIRAIKDAGGYPALIAYDEVTTQLNAWEPDGMMLIGGFFHSPKEWYETMPETDVDKRGLAYLTMLQYAKAHKLPLLGICGGEQMLAGSEGAMMTMGVKGHKIGGEVIAHKVQIEPGSLLASIIGVPEIMTNSAHSEAVIKEKCGNCIITAQAEDGIAEALELKQPWNDFVLGVQWHPERFVKKGDQPSIKIFSGFIESAKNYQRQQKHRALGN